MGAISAFILGITSLAAGWAIHSVSKNRRSDGFDNGPSWPMFTGLRRLLRYIGSVAEAGYDIVGIGLRDWTGVDREHVSSRVGRERNKFAADIRAAAEDVEIATTILMEEMQSAFHIFSETELKPAVTALREEARELGADLSEGLVADSVISARDTFLAVRLFFLRSFGLPRPNDQRH
jgi:hypothetical protein